MEYKKIDDLMFLINQYIHNPKSQELIIRAYNRAYELHQGQLRKSGEPYIIHPLNVACILAELHVGPDTICAGLLHDVVEDTQISKEELAQEFSEDIAEIVDGVTKISNLKFVSLEEKQVENHQKMLLAMGRDIRVIVVKLADRLHNIRTLNFMPAEKRERIARETLEIYAPLAHKLGMFRIKAELEDTALKYVDTAAYNKIANLIKNDNSARMSNVDHTINEISRILDSQDVKDYKIKGRIKNIYSIYKKMVNQSKDFEDIYDILAIRVIVNTIGECYHVLGLIHAHYTPIPKRFKDYIAVPKPNMYQSLHTTVISEDGFTFEVQIRTKEMDAVAELGVAAHWAYKEGNGYNSAKEQQEIENKLHWFRDFVSMSNSSGGEDAKDFIDSLTHDIFEANVYVFTPKGKVIELPQGSTPVDFAYHIHTRVGDTCVGALVNGVMVPLNTVLKTGDLVEIKTNKNNPGPSEGWLDFVKSSAAKSAIRKYVAKKNAELIREEKIAKGKQSCLDAFRDRGVDEDEMMEHLSDSKLLDYFGFDSVDDLFVGVTGRKPVPSAIIDFLKIKRPVNIPTQAKVKTKSGDSCPVYCRGVGKIAISLASCCTPIPGDGIVGYVTKGKGIVVHRNNCPNIINEHERLVEVLWRDDIEYATYPVDIMIEANDRNNLVVDIMSTLTSAKVTLSSLHARLANNGVVDISATLLVSDAKRLNDVFNIIRSVSGVYSVTRIIH